MSGVLGFLFLTFFFGCFENSSLSSESESDRTGQSFTLLLKFSGEDSAITGIRIEADGSLLCDSLFSAENSRPDTLLFRCDSIPGSSESIQVKVRGKIRGSDTLTYAGPLRLPLAPLYSKQAGAFSLMLIPETAESASGWPDTVQLALSIIRVLKTVADSPYVIIKLTDNAWDDKEADVNGGRVIWSGWDGHDYEIFLFDGLNIRQLSDNDFNDVSPKISGEEAVWTAYIGLNAEIYYWNGEEAVRITSNLYADEYPEVHEGVIVWERSEPQGHEVYMYSGGLTQKVSESASCSDQNPHVHSGDIVWWRNCAGQDTSYTGIMLFSGGEERVLASHSGGTHYAPIFPRIHNGVVVWSDMVVDSEREEDTVTFWKRDLDLFFYDGENISQFSGANPSEEMVDIASFPRYRVRSYYLYNDMGQVNSRQAVWTRGKYSYAENRYLDQSSEIVFFDGDAQRVLTDNDYMDEFPQLHGGLVTWQANVNGTGEIYIFRGGTPERMTNNDGDDVYPRVHEGLVVWQGKDGDDYEIYIARVE